MDLPVVNRAIRDRSGIDLLARRGGDNFARQIKRMAGPQHRRQRLLPAGAVGNGGAKGPILRFSA